MTFEIFFDAQLPSTGFSVKLLTQKQRLWHQFWENIFCGNILTEYPMCIVLSMNLYKENRCTHVKGFCQRCKRKGQSEGEENVDWKFSLNQFGPNGKIVSREKQWER